MVKNHDPMSNKTRGPIPLPSGDVPTETECMSICIPKGGDYRRQLFGALYEFTHWNNYERDDTHKGTLVAQAWRAAIMQGMLSCLQYRVNGGVPQFSSDGGATWQNAPSVNDGSTGYDPRNDEPLLPARTGDNKRCLAAANAVAVLVELHREVVKWYNENAPLLACLGAIALALGIFFPVSWAVFGLSLSSVTLAIAFLTRSGILNNEAFTAEIQAQLQCILYLNMDVNGHISQPAFDLIVGQVGSKSGDMWGQIGYYIEEVAGYAGMNNAATTTSVTEATCDECSAWCYEFDFTLDDFSEWWSIGAYGAYTPGVGYTQTAAGSGVGIDVSMAAPEVTGGEYTWLECDTAANVNVGNYSATFGTFRMWTDTTPVTQLYTSGGMSVAGPVNCNLNPSGIPSGGYITISRVLVRGTGTCPFGTPNCE